MCSTSSLLSPNISMYSRAKQSENSHTRVCIYFFCSSGRLALTYVGLATDPSTISISASQSFEEKPCPSFPSCSISSSTSWISLVREQNSSVPHRCRSRLLSSLVIKAHSFKLSYIHRLYTDRYDAIFAYADVVIHVEVSTGQRCHAAILGST
jgi:hypothetical protein